MSSTFWTRDDAGSLTFASNGGYDVFVETGTHLGSTLYEAGKVFKRTRSVDINRETAVRASQLCPSAEVWVGDSGDRIYTMIADLDGCRVCFWLDAHATDASITKDQCPLLGEIEAIAHMDWEYTPLILIDDAPCFGASEPMFQGHIPAQWPSLDRIKEVLGARWSVAVEGLVIVCRPA